MGRHQTKPETDADALKVVVTGWEFVVTGASVDVTAKVTTNSQSYVNFQVVVTGFLSCTGHGYDGYRNFYY